MSACAPLADRELRREGSAAQRRLGNTANNYAGPDVRAARHGARAWLWRNSSLPRIKACGRYRTGDAVHLEQGEHGGRLSGLQHCGSVWSCPVCSARIQAERSRELADVIENHHDRGGHVAMLTLTMRHNARQSLQALWGPLGAAWNIATAQNHPVRAARAAAGVMGFMRTVEATHGRNGWHLHIHALVFLEPGADLEQLGELDEVIAAGWIGALTRKGMPAPTRAHGCELRLLELGAARAEVSRYFAKASYLGERAAAKRAAGEVTQTSTKAAGYGNKTPWQLLDDAIAGDQRARRLWSEWETVSRGRRCHTWSRGLRRALQLDDELTDEELADLPAQTTPPTPMLRFTTPAWDQWLVHHPHAHPALLNAADTASTTRALKVLTDLSDRPPAWSIEQWETDTQTWVPLNLPPAGCIACDTGIDTPRRPELSAFVWIPCNARTEPRQERRAHSSDRPQPTLGIRLLGGYASRRAEPRGPNAYRVCASSSYARGSLN